MKRFLLPVLGLFAVAIFFLRSSTAEPVLTNNAFEYATIRWHGRDNTCVVLPDGKVDFVGAKLKDVRRPERADERAFYMNVLMNSMVRDGFELAAIGGDENSIVMKRPLRQTAR